MSSAQTLKHALAPLLLVTLAACGGGKGGGSDQVAPDDSPVGGGTGTVSFADVNAIFVDHCAQCHTQGPKPHFIGQQSVVDQNKDELLFVLTTTDPKQSMPKIIPTTPLTDAQKQTIVRYAEALHQRGSSKPTLTYQADILPILDQSCAQCHGDNAGHGRRLRFVGHQDVFDGNVAEIVERVTTTNKDEVMPPIPATPLTADEKAKVLAYLNGVH